MKKISVVIAAYNCEKYISTCIDSILEQTFTDFDIIICDDCSTDNTWKILQQYNELSNVKLLQNKENKHSAYTRNRCIKESQSEYIAIQDADDFSEPSRLFKQVAMLDKNPLITYVGTGMVQFDDNGVWSKRYKKTKPVKEDFLFNMPFAHATLMFRRTALNEVGSYRVANETERVEDYDLLMRLFASKYIGVNLQEALYYYRVDKETIGRRKYRYRVNESIVRYKCFKALQLFPKGYLYVLKPIFIGLIPNEIIEYIKSNRGKKHGKLKYRK